MNDHGEVAHGIRTILSVFHDKESARRDRLIGILDRIASGAAAEGITRFDKCIPHLPSSVYIGCLAQIPADDDMGLLSMWRAYAASGNGVALVMNSTPFLAQTDALAAYSTPVLYLTDSEFADAVDRSLDSIEEHLAAFSLVTFEQLAHMVFWWLLMMAVSLKHKAFREEAEWRIVYIPGLWKSGAIASGVECIGGVPQIVQKIPLKNDEASGLFGAHPEDLINRLIIGPTQFQDVVAEALVGSLVAAGVREPHSRLRFSSIPLRV